VNPSLTITAMTERAMSLIPRADDAGPVRPLTMPANLPQPTVVVGRRRRALAWAGLAALGGMLLFGLWKNGKRG